MTKPSIELFLFLFKDVSMWYLNNIICTLCFLFVSFSPLRAQSVFAEAAQKRADEQKLHEYFQKHNLQPKRGPGGLYYIITKEGTGKQILAGETVTMNYTGKLLDGTIFDSNTDPKFHHQEPFVIEIGVGKVIRGWDKGVQQLKKGTVATLYIPSQMGYGAEGQPDIPANSILIFDVEITDVRR